MYIDTPAVNASSRIFGARPRAQRSLCLLALLVGDAAAGLAGALAGGLAFAAAAILRAFAKGLFVKSNDVFHFGILRKRFELIYYSTRNPFSQILTFLH